MQGNTRTYTLPSRVDDEGDTISELRNFGLASSFITEVGDKLTIKPTFETEA